MTYEEKMALCIENKKQRKYERLHSLFIDTESGTYILDGKSMNDVIEFTLHMGADGLQLNVTYDLDILKCNFE